MKDGWFFCLNEKSPELTFKQNKKCAGDPSRVNVRTVLILSGEKRVTYNYTAGVGTVVSAFGAPRYPFVRQLCVKTSRHKPTQFPFSHNKPRRDISLEAESVLLFRPTGVFGASVDLWDFEGDGPWQRGPPVRPFTHRQGCPGSPGIAFDKGPPCTYFLASLNSSLLGSTCLNYCLLN